MSRYSSKHTEIYKALIITDFHLKVKKSASSNFDCFNSKEMI